MTEGADSNKLPKLECAHARKGLVESLRRDRPARLLRSTLAVAPALFAHAAVTVA